MAYQSPAVARQRFTVADQAAGSQMLAWKDYVSRILDVPVSRTQVARGFRGEIDTYALGDMRYLDSRTDPVSQSRTAARISTDNVTDYVFHVTLDGLVETETGTHRKSVQYVPGIVVLDMAQPMTMRRPTAAHVLAFFLPRAMVEAILPEAESLHGQVLSYSDPFTRLLREHLRLLRRDLATMDDMDAESALRSGTELIVASFGKMAQVGQTARAAARTAMLPQVKRHIHANIHSRDLVPERILEGFPLTRPTLYRMFEPEGGLHAYIRNCRLREAARRLSGVPAMPVSRIAEALGFSHASDFTRAFHRAYGMAPQAFRALELDWFS